ncbi:single-stranded DNA-binding protein [Lipingzhangella sp. LS1_29]|uniref:Single-stranded DNA-binding protein n=1 Tax=Lipingzhangella rawalii TaxID=2055835 RepID=A0ABU2H813_9ACTN|nr:single-stranded DNA-binding protein [Lipingzhangella rawalii]MDS1271451.1 single-stranded DNA-binding protein [Lipingzhangella rawalii]
MAGDTQITIVGNLVDDPNHTFTPSGAARTTFRVASTPRYFDRQSGEWKDGNALFLNCTMWRQMAENGAETLQRGMRVIVQGRLRQYTPETPDSQGERRTFYNVEVDEVGPSLRYATAKVTKTPSRGGGGGFGGGQGGQGGGFGGPQPGNQPPANDPWATGASGFSEEPPF